jgi:type II secretory pathway pseudopilin PulG
MHQFVLDLITAIWNTEYMEETARPTNPQPVTPPQTPSTHRNIVPLVVVAVIAALLASLGTYLVMSSQQNKQVQMTNQQNNIPSPSQTIEVSPTQTAVTTNPANWNTFTDPKGKFSFRYPDTWKVNPNGPMTPVAELDTHTVVSVLDPNTPITGIQMDVAVYPGYNQLSEYEFLKQYWCPDSVIDKQYVDSCVKDLKIHNKVNGTQFSIVEILSIIPGALGPAAWTTHDNYGVFILTNNLRYTNAEDMKLLDQILSTFEFTK